MNHVRNISPEFAKKLQQAKRNTKETEKKRKKQYEEFFKRNPKPEEKRCEHGVARIVHKPHPMEPTWVMAQGDICDVCEAYDAKESRIDYCCDNLDIPVRYHSKDWQSKYYQDYIDKGGIVFSGSVGTGKTHEAIMLIKKIYVEESLSVKFEVAADMAMNLKGSIKTENYQDLIKNYREREVLFLDDLGAESATDFMVESLYNIINYRYNMILPIIFTTNLNAKDFANAYGQRLLSRIIEMSHFVKLNGKDKRIELDTKIKYK